ncbi:MAG: amidohydrolase family protein [Betaproteobacteria bacterium]|nr:amidohydrolase family protein [Betaproteobacteria bacterium]
MRTFVRCGKLFDGLGDAWTTAATVVVEDGKVSFVGASGAAPHPDAGAGDLVLDYAKYCVIPGLIDLHTHLAYGNAKSEENIDIYAPMEFRALRGLFFSQQVLAAGYTSICSPGDAGRISLSVRNAINAGLFHGPRVMAAGPYITSRQGLADWYPSWIGTPETGVGHLVRSLDESIEEVRRQVKEGVDCIKIAMDGRMKRDDGEYMAAFTQRETSAIVEEVHRLGRKAIVHARGREAVLYAARARVDLIFHASYMDEEGLAAVVANRCAIAPTLTFLRHDIDFTQPADQAWHTGRRAASQEEFDTACRVLARARDAGVPLLPGTDSGFALTPYGEWHAKELMIFAKYLGMTNAQALRSATSEAAKFLNFGSGVGAIECGRRADMVAVDGDPLQDVGVLLEKRRIKAVLKDGIEMDLRRREYDPAKVSDFSHQWWSTLYTQDRAAAIFGESSMSV